MKTQSNGQLFGSFNDLTVNLALMAIMFAGGIGVSTAQTSAQLAVNVRGISQSAPPTNVTEYRWTVEEDATKLSVPGVPATKANYSFSFHTSYMPVLAAGRVGTLKAGVIADPDVARLYAQGFPEVCPAVPVRPCMDPNKRYYVSIAADGYQMGGAPVVIRNGQATATVFVNQYPVPTAQVSVFAFNDNSPINGAPDLPQETGLKGFTVQLFEAGGTYGQSGGAVTQDGFGNPLGTTYNADGTVKVRGNGIVLTGADGTATIKNLFPAKYTVVIVPPPNTDWHQTSTIEGTRGSDAWVKNNEPSFFQEFGPPGHHVFIGFTKSGCILGKSLTGNGCNGLNGGAYSVTGKIVNIHNSRPPQYNFEKGAPVPECWVGLNETNGGTRALYATPCKKDSTFEIPNVPNGTYELVVWDDPLDMIIGTQTITVSNGPMTMGEVPVFSWFGRYQGRVFQDIDGTGLPFFAEPYSRPYIEVNPVTGVETEKTRAFAANDLKPPFGEGIASNIRFRDGSIYQSTVTKQDGTFAFTELFPFFNWMIAEIDYARFKVTGATMVTDAGGKIDPVANKANLWKAEKGSYGSNDPAYAYDPWIRLNPQSQGICSAEDVAANLDSNGKIIDATVCFKVGEKFYRTEQGVILLEGMQTFLGQTNHIEWGKQPYAGQLNGAKNENGGIAGIVHYAITRAEDDPRFAAAENWEPGIPRVQVNLYLDCDADGKIDKPSNDGTGQCAADGLSTAGYKAELPDVDNYPYCWRAANNPDLCPSGIYGMGPEDSKRVTSRANYAAAQAAQLGVPIGENDFLYGDVFRWGTPGGAVADQLAVGLGKTDAWDDSVPRDCKNAPSGAVGNGGIPFNDTLDCFDGLYNFNQVKPAVFDGGYAFGRVAGQAELPVFIGAAGKGTYVVEAVAPPGYLHQGNGDKNVTFGDALQASTAALPFECVGMELPVPAKLTLFADNTTDTDNPNFSGGATWRKCDMKAVPLVPGTNPAPDFYMFTEAPVAGHGVGFILDDTASEFNRFAPTFGEKYAPPHLPISIQDWTGREISRVYSDQFGSYNFLVPSSFTINPPFPSGVMPNMMVSCMNHPGPIVDERVTVKDAAGNVIPNPTLGQKIIDPFFNRKYTQFCYTLQYLAGKTTYLDTPVLPIAAFATVEKNPLDCECQDKTPAIYSANNPSAATNGGNNGPWVPGAGGTLTIVSAGSAVEVVNPAFDPTVTDAADVRSQRHITRDYGFGSAGGTARLGTTPLTVTSWSPDLLSVTVPSSLSTGAYQLTITRNDSGKESVVGITVHKGGNAPIVVQPGGSIQAVIDASTTPAGSLITIPPGTYNEYLILDKRVRLQGWGANSVTINASKASAGGLAAWRTLLNKKVDARCSLADGATAGVVPSFVTYPLTGCPTTTPIDTDTGGPTLVAGPSRTFDPLPGQTLGINNANNEPILFGAEEGAGILAVGRSNNNGNGCSNTNSAYRIDGLTVTGSDAGGGILASGYNCNLQITNNRVVANYGTYGGGIRVGHTALVDGDTFTDGVNNTVAIHHNWVSQNGASEIASGDGGAGGITMGTGSNGYVISDNYVCGNFSMSDGGGIAHVGVSQASSNSPNLIARNQILLNQTFNQSADPTGGGLFIGGQIALAGGASEGTSHVSVDRNLIQYNHAGAGAGGGVSIARTASNDNVVLTNNMIVNNASAYAGGGIAVTEASGNVRVVNNTVADNVSTATNRQSFPAGPKVQSTAQIAGIARLNGPNPTLLNNIIWGNRSFTWSITPTDPNLPQTTALADAGIWDLGVLGDTSHTALPSTNSLLTAGAGNSAATNNVLSTEAQVAFARRINVIYQTDTDQPVALPETTIMQTALTFDEGGNFINVNFSPLSPWSIVPGTEFGITPRADYHIGQASSAVDKGANRTTGNNGNRVPTADYDAQNRISTTANPVDIGADEIIPPAPTVTSISPAVGLRPSNGTATYSVTLTGTNLTGATLSENSSGFALANVVASATQITADVQVSSTATLGNTAITVNGAGGSIAVNFAVYVSVAFTAESGPAQLNNAGATLAFGNQSGAVQDTVTVTVGGFDAVTFQSATVTNGTGTAFSKGADSCSGTTKNPGDTCTITINFNGPAGNSSRTGTLSVPYTGPSGSPVNLSLTGS